MIIWCCTLFQSTPSWRGRLNTSTTIRFTENFNPRPREEGDHFKINIAYMQVKFQSTPSWRGRRLLRLTGEINSIFQSTPSWRGRHSSCRLFIYRFFYFNPRPREEGDLSVRPLQFSQEYFNPRPREEGDVSVVPNTLYKLISIHALVKRATCGSFKDRQTGKISIHALVKRATLVNFVELELILFQSTPSWRGRRNRRNLTT